jgi:hypothetical protein
MRGAVVLKDELRSTKGESVLRSLAKNRVALGSSRDQCYAFLMARHLRLGEDSPARVLVKDMFKYICSFVIKREKLLFFRQGSFLELDLNSGALVELPPMPVSLSNGFGCIRSNNKELFVFGGVDDAHTPNLDCFVFEFASRTWRCEENVFGEDDGRLNGSCVIYKNLVVVVGSMRPAAQLASEAAPDFAFLLPSGKIVDLPPRPVSLFAACLCFCFFGSSLFPRAWIVLVSQNPFFWARFWWSLQLLQGASLSSGTWLCADPQKNRESAASLLFIWI